MEMMKFIYILFALGLVAIVNTSKLQLNYLPGKAYEYEYVSQHVNSGGVKDGKGVFGSKVTIIFL